MGSLREEIGAVNACGLGQGAGHQGLGDTDAEAAGQKLVEDKSFGGVELIPCGKDAGFSRILVQRGETADFEDPVGECSLGGFTWRWQDEGNGFG